MTHCLGSFASFSSASSARDAEPCKAIRPKTDVETTKSFFIRFLLGFFAYLFVGIPSRSGTWKLAQERNAFAQKRNPTHFSADFHRRERPQSCAAAGLFAG